MMEKDKMEIEVVMETVEIRWKLMEDTMKAKDKVEAEGSQDGG